MISNDLHIIDPETRNADLIGTLISRNAGNVLDQISVKKAQTFHELKSQLMQTDVSTDTDFQEQFLDWAGINKRSFRKSKQEALFALMETSKHNATFPFREAYRAVFASQAKKFQRKHFRILTQAAHLINPAYPIMNKGLGSFYRFKAIRGTSQTMHDAFSTLMRFYDYVQETFTQMKDMQEMRAPLIALKIKLKQSSIFLPEEKRLDLLVRGMARLEAADGAVRYR